MTALAARGLRIDRPGFALGPIDLEIAAGEALLAFGPSLAGKTALLKALVGLAPARGTVRIGTVEVSLSDPPPLEPLRVQVGMVFQNDALFDSLTVRENVAVPLLRRGIADAGPRVAQALADVGLTEAADKLPEQLSGGMRKRAGLARALAVEPSVLLVDEPLAGLDPGTQKRIASLLGAARDRGCALLIAVADPSALWDVCGQAIALEHGQIIARGPSERVRADAAQLLGAA